MDIMQRQSSTDFEDLDGSDFDSCDDDDIYDCPEQDNTYQADRPGDPDGQEEGDEIYDTPDDAREQLAAMNSVQDQQNFSNRSNDHQDAASDQLDQSSESTSIANARAFFANKENTSGPHSGVPAKPRTKPAIAQRWPPPKTEGMDVEAEKPRSATQYNEKHRAIFNKLSRVIGDGKSWERNNNAPGNDVDQGSSSASNRSVNAHPGIVDRSDRPNLKDPQSRVQPVIKPPRNIPNGKYQTAAYEAEQHECIPQPPHPRGINSTSEIEEEEQYIEPLNNSTAISTPSFQSPSQISKQEGQSNLSNMPRPVSERQPNRTMNYADIIIDPLPRAQRLPKSNKTAFNTLRNPSIQNNNHSTPEPFSEENYEVTGPGGEAPALPSGRPNLGKPGIYPAPQLGRQVFTPSNKPRAVDPPQENYKVPVSENPPALPPGRPGKRDPGMPPGLTSSRQVSAPARGTQAQDLSPENYEIPGSCNPPALPPGRPDKRGHGISSGQPPRREGYPPPIASQPQEVTPENYEVPGSSHVPTLAPGRPDRRGPGLPSGQPQDVSQENYEVPDSGNTSGLPPGRPTKTDHRILSSQPSSGKRFPPQNIAHAQDLSEENYEVADSGSAPKLPPGRMDRGGPSIPPGLPSKGQKFHPQNIPHAQDLLQENYEVLDSGSAPQLPPGRPDRTGHRIPHGQMSVGKGPPPQNNCQPQGFSQENYEVPDAGSPPGIPPDRPSRGGPGIIRGLPSGGKGFTPQSNTRQQDLSQENYEVPDAGSPPGIPPGRPGRGGPGITRGVPSDGKGFTPQSSTQPQDLSQENYEVPDAGNVPELPPDRPSRGGPGITRGVPSGGKGFTPQSSTQPQPQDPSQENYEVPDAGNVPELPPDRPSRGGPGITRGVPSGGKGFAPQSSTQPQPQDPSQENYEVPDAGNVPELPPDRPSRGGPGITRGVPSGGKGFAPQSSTQPQPQDPSQENYEVPDAGNVPELPPDRPSRGGPGITRGVPSGGKGFTLQSSTQPQPHDTSQENYEVPDAGNVPDLPPDRPSRGGPGITRGVPSGGKGFTPQSSTQPQPQDPSQENYEVPDAGNVPDLPPDRPSRGGTGITPGRKSSVKGFPSQKNTEAQDLSPENYEVPDTCNAPAVPPDRAHKGLPIAPVNKNPAVPTKPKNRSLKNLFHSSKKTQPKPSKLVKEKQDVQQPQSTSSGSECPVVEQENYEVMDGENAEPQENYEIVDQTPSGKAHSGRRPPEGQEHRGGIAKPTRTFSPEDQMLNQVLVGLTNPQQAERRQQQQQQQQPLSRRERPPSVRIVPPRPSDSEQPLLDLHELANVAAEPDSQRSPVKLPKPPIEQEPWYFCSIDRPGAERKLNGVQMDGAFIVRKNSNGVGYSISIYYQGDIRHLKIGKKGSGYHLGTSEKSFECVQDLIAYFKSFPIELKQGGKTKLTVTAPKS